MMTKLAAIFLDFLFIAIGVFGVYRLNINPLMKRIETLCEENDDLLKTNYKLAKEIDKLTDEVQTYRNSFNNN